MLKHILSASEDEDRTHIMLISGVHLFLFVENS